MKAPRPLESPCDAIVIGAGHNGLVAAFHLARAGLRVRVPERLDVVDVVGGCAVTEEFHPGSRNSVASYPVSLLQPQIIADVELARPGLRIVTRPMGQSPAPARRRCAGAGRQDGGHAGRVRRLRRPRCRSLPARGMGRRRGDHDQMAGLRWL